MILYGKVTVNCCFNYLHGCQNSSKTLLLWEQEDQQETQVTFL